MGMVVFLMMIWVLLLSLRRMRMMRMRMRVILIWCRMMKRKMRIWLKRVVLGLCKWVVVLMMKICRMSMRVWILMFKILMFIGFRGRFFKFMISRLIFNSVRRWLKKCLKYLLKGTIGRSRLSFWCILILISLVLLSFFWEIGRRLCGVYGWYE